MLGSEELAQVAYTRYRYLHPDDVAASLIHVLSAPPHVQVSSVVNSQGEISVSKGTVALGAIHPDAGCFGWPFVNLMSEQQKFSTTRFLLPPDETNQSNGPTTTG